MTQHRKIYLAENGLYLLIFLIAVLSPVIRFLEKGGDHPFFFHDWERLIPFFIVFVVNNFILAPKYLLKSKFSAYFFFVALLILAVVLIDIYPFWEKRPPMPLRGEMLPPPFKPNFNFGVLLISLLIIGFNSGVKIIVRWIKEEKERRERDLHYLNAELAYLKHQLSPHFFMNTLNNIHALVDIDSGGAKDAIIKLSRLMRYLLYEAEGERVQLKKEVEFMESYIELMRLRYDESKLSINLYYPQNIHSIFVPSLLFLPLIENAFKHGVQAGRDCFIDILFEISEDTVSLILKNSNFQNKNRIFNEASGIGLDNIRKRLDLIYSRQYTFDIQEKENVFQVFLKIPIDYAKMSDIGR